MAHPKHETVRRRYGYQCGYCGVSETETGGELTVDHHQPTSAGGDDSDENLVYCCYRCNLYKSNHYTGQVAGSGSSVLHPLHDAIETHLRENPLTGRLEALTEVGRIHIDLLQLNRAALVENRLQHHLAREDAALREQWRQEIAELHLTVKAFQAYVALLEERLGLR